MTIRFVDLFSGVGGFHLGLTRCNNNEEKNITKLNNIIQPEETDFECVWSNDINRYANQVYRHNFREVPHSTQDIREVNVVDIPPHDILCGGFPCQSFSVAGKREGFDDTRGTLFFEICRIAEYHRPSLLFLENVKGLLSHDGGNTLGTILNSLENLGYWWEYQIFNSKYFGVPQNRERVFIIGHSGDKRTRPIFPITENGGITTGTQGTTRRTGSRVRDEDNSVAGSLRVGGSGREENLVASTISARCYKDGKQNLISTFGTNKNSQGYRVYDPDGIASTIASQAGGVGAKTGLYLIPEKTEPIILKRHRKDEIRNHGQLCSTLTESHEHKGGANPPIIVLPEKSTTQEQHEKDEITVYQELRKGSFRTETKGIVPTLVGKMGTGGNNIPCIATKVIVEHKKITERSGEYGSGFKEEEAFCLDSSSGRDQVIHIMENNEEKERILNTRIRRLTPCECERLQGFPELESSIYIHIHDNMICIDLQKSYVNVETKNPKLLKHVGTVENVENKENVLFVEKNLNTNSQQIEKHVPVNVHISCVGEKIEIHSQKKLFSYANFVENQNSYLQYINQEDFVQMLVGINLIVEKILLCGKVELQENEHYSVVQKNGKIYVRLYGKGIMQHVEDVKNDSITLKKHLKCIILNHLNSKIIDLNWITSFCYVISAIIGCIQKKTEINNSLNLSLYEKRGWTEKGLTTDGETVDISDTQRYKLMGNAVTVPVITFLGHKIRNILTEERK